MKRFALLVLALGLGFTTAASFAAEPVEGKDYVRLKNPQPVETGKKIEVIEFFSYGCPHCADLEPTLDGWLAKLPQDVEFRRVPVIFQPRWEPLAKIYYTLDALGVESSLSPEVFKAIHSAGVPLYQDKAFFDWAAAHGLDRTKVQDTFNSFGVNSRFNRAKALVQAYNIQSVPTVVVDGKYVTSERLAHADYPRGIDAMIAKARAERGKP